MPVHQDPHVDADRKLTIRPPQVSCFKKARARRRADLFSGLVHPTIAHISSGDTPIAPLP
jgi:hypothetical protein